MAIQYYEHEQPFGDGKVNAETYRALWYHILLHLRRVALNYLDYINQLYILSYCTQDQLSLLPRFNST